MIVRPSMNILKELRKEGVDCLMPYTHANFLVRWLFWKRLEKVVDISDNIKAKSVLDFGCGAGILLPTLLNKYQEVYGTDTRIWYSQRFKQRFKLNKLWLEEANEKSTGFTEEKFDIIYALDVLEHCKNIRPPVSEILRILKKDGYLVLSGPTENFLYQFSRIFFGYRKPDDHFHTIEGIISFLSKHFHIEEVITIPFSFPSQLVYFKIIRARKVN